MVYWLSSFVNLVDSVHICHVTKTQSIHHTNLFSRHNSTIWSVWLNGCAYVRIPLQSLKISDIVLVLRNPIGISLFKFDNRNTRTRCQLPPWPNVSIVDFEHVIVGWGRSSLTFRRLESEASLNTGTVLMVPLLTLCMVLPLIFRYITVSILEHSHAMVKRVIVLIFDRFACP